MASAAEDEARDAIFKAITAIAEIAPNFSGATQGELVRDCAYAWRALVGGNQPGSVIVKTEYRG